MDDHFSHLEEFLKKQAECDCEHEEDFDAMALGLGAGAASDMDSFLQGKPLGGDYFTSMTDLAYGESPEVEETWPPTAGARVAFANEDNLEALISYKNPPIGEKGTVVKVRSANVEGTHYNDRVFVKFDSGRFMPVHRAHLSSAKSNAKKANNVRMVVQAGMDLTSLFSSTDSGNDLIHKATKDIWSMKQDGESFIIERLFDVNGDPLKI